MPIKKAPTKPKEIKFTNSLNINLFTSKGRLKPGQSTILPVIEANKLKAQLK